LKVKVFYYGAPSSVLPRALLALRAKAKWLRYPIAFVLVLLWLLLIPPSWIAIKLGQIGHAIAGWCGLDSHEW
jgi:hypothetical protein